MKIYLDTCCLNRPFDDQSYDRIKIESEAIMIILFNLAYGKWIWIGSEALELEVNKTPDRDRLKRLKLLMKYTQESVKIDRKEIDRAKQLENFGFHAMDALHISCAESLEADIFLTTDKKLLNLSFRLSEKLKVRVENPLKWLSEVI